MSEALLEIRDLSVDYLLDDGAFRAVKNVSFEIGRSELFGLAGESGCGKSTIAYAITRLAKPPAWVAGGEILLDGQDLLKLPEEALQIGALAAHRHGVPERDEFAQPTDAGRGAVPRRSVQHTGASRAQSRARAEEMFKLVGIASSRLSDYPHQFSRRHAPAHRHRHLPRA